MAVQPHARFYNGLPPVRPQRWRWLLAGAGVLIAGVVIAVPVFALAYATHSVPSSWWGGGGRTLGGDAELFDWYSLLWVGGALLIGGVLGASLARRWWITLALYTAGLALWAWMMATLDSRYGYSYGSDHTVGLTYAWLFWIFGVSAGVGVRGLIHRRHVLRASFLSQPG